jgi:hypothetical protein
VYAGSAILAWDVLDEGDDSYEDLLSPAATLKWQANIIIAI